ncbi:TIR domain-containing protein [Actinoplanes sp. TRM 88003]|uniref:TIR domain-containing protein n=1 Tax=Paractinoplanes aksuensis TaxID=2939490 RepID=A0ABT1E1Q8_9ACTN|nr:TIR domain-containing protein [Actinoplanes aksuensis]MCO8277047.1 TIR domain-containing protein [Actinoplanes aksuensis]
MTNFFISYTHSDRDWAVWLDWLLRSAGYSVVMQESDFTVGEDFVKKIEQATQEAERTIAVLSRRYQMAPFASVEWRVAFARDPDGSRGLIIPVLVEDYPVSGLLSLRTHIDVTDLSNGQATTAILTGLDRLHLDKTGDPHFDRPQPPFPAPPPTPSVLEQGGDAEQRLVTVASMKVAMRVGPEVDGLRMLHANQSLERIVEPIVGEYGGVSLTRTSLDLLLVFGARQAHDDDAVRAVLACLEIHSALEANVELPEVTVSTGVATGTALIIDDEGRPSYPFLVEGPVMQISGHQQSLAAENQILVDRMTEAITNRDITYEARRDGYEPAGRLLGVVDTPRLVGLVGRDAELRRLTATYELVMSAGNPEFVTVIGTPGVGKTRLLEELRNKLAGTVAHWQVVRSYPYGDPVLWPLARLFKDYASISDHDSEEVLETKLRSVLHRFRLEEVEVNWLLGHLLPLIGTSERADWQPTDRDEAFGAYRRVLEEIASTGPTVIVFEDAHWADESLLDFIEDMAESLSATRLMVAILARPELTQRRDTWLGGRPRVTTITLEPLTESETRTLIDEIASASGDGLPETAVAMIVSKVGGNPLFVEEYVKPLLDAQAGETAATAAEGLQPPPTIHASIGGRLDQLPEVERSFLLDAAVIGRVMSLPFLGHLTDQDEPSTRRLVDRLVRHGFLVQVRRGGASYRREYVFRHDVMRDVALSRMSRRSRLNRHLRAAAYLASRVGEAVADTTELLAFHYHAAMQLTEALGDDSEGLRDPAVDAFIAAGDRAADLGIASNAVKHYDLALTLCPAGDDRLPEIMLRAGRAQLHSGVDSSDLLSRAREELRRLGRYERAAEADVLLAGMALATGDRQRADRLVMQALELAASGSPTSSTTVAILITCSAHLCLLGRYKEAISAGLKAIQIAEQRVLPSRVARALTHVGLAHVMTGRPSGIGEIKQSIEIQKRLGGSVAPISYSSLAYAYANLGDVAGTLEATESGFRVATNQWSRPERLWLRGEQAFGDFWRGDWDAVLKTADYFERASRRHFMEPSVRNRRAAILLARDEFHEALSEARESLRLTEKFTAPIGMPPAMSVYASCLLRSGRMEEAGDLIGKLLDFQRGKVLDPALGIEFPVQLKALGFGSSVLQEMEIKPSGWLDAARLCLQGRFGDAVEKYRAIGSLPDVAIGQVMVAETLIARAEVVEAGDRLREAHAFFRSVHARHYLERVDELFRIAGPSAGSPDVE